MKFKFRLQTLLKIRENARKEAQGELAKAHEAERIVMNKIEELGQEIARCGEETRKAILHGKIDVNFMIGLRRHEAYLISQRGLAQQQLTQVREEIERRRIILMNADREVKTLEKLKEKQRERFMDDIRVSDMKQMDEIAGRDRREKEPEHAQ